MLVHIWVFTWAPVSATADKQHQDGGDAVQTYNQQMAEDSEHRHRQRRRRRCGIRTRSWGRAEHMEIRTSLCFSHIEMLNTGRSTLYFSMSCHSIRNRCSFKYLQQSACSDLIPSPYQCRLHCSCRRLHQTFAHCRWCGLQRSSPCETHSPCRWRGLCNCHNEVCSSKWHYFLPSLAEQAFLGSRDLNKYRQTKKHKLMKLVDDCTATL